MCIPSVMNEPTDNSGVSHGAKDSMRLILFQPAHCNLDSVHPVEYELVASMIRWIHSPALTPLQLAAKPCSHNSGVFRCRARGTIRLMKDWQRRYNDLRP
jgi:hypothetical protein